MKQNMNPQRTDLPSSVELEFESFQTIPLMMPPLMRRYVTLSSTVNCTSRGRPAASQTAWAVLGLMAANDIRSDSVARGIAYLLRTQQKDGSWDEADRTGTGFPRVFYLKYHMYRQYFPLLALTTYAKMVAEESASAARNGH